MRSTPTPEARREYYRKRYAGDSPAATAAREARRLASRAFYTANRARISEQRYIRKQGATFDVAGYLLDELRGYIMGGSTCRDPERARQLLTVPACVALDYIALESWRPRGSFRVSDAVQFVRDPALFDLKTEKGKRALCDVRNLTVYVK